MEFREIEETDKITPGEYLLHKPTNQIVMCGAFMREASRIKVVVNGRVMIGATKDFQKIYMDPSELLQQPNALLIVRESYKPDWFDDLPGGKTILKMDAAFETYLLLEQTSPSPG